MMYAKGHKQKASLLAQQQEALKVQREQQRKEIADEEAALAELQRKLHATRTRHQNDARTLHQSHVVAITTMAAELEKEASTLWEGANLPIHHMPRLKGFTLPLAPKSAVLGASTMPSQAALSSANSAAAAQAAAAHAAAAHAAAAAAGLTLPMIPPLGNWWPMPPPGSVLQPNSRSVLQQPGSMIPAGSVSMPGSAASSVPMTAPMPLPHATNTTPFGMLPQAGAPTTAPDPAAPAPVMPMLSQMTPEALAAAGQPPSAFQYIALTSQQAAASIAGCWVSTSVKFADSGIESCASTSRPTLIRS
jgi:hypothetical protein